MNLIYIVTDTWRADFCGCYGNNWIKIENSLEVSALHHNVLGGFMSLRIGLCSIGEGKIKFKNFVYKPIK